MRTKAIKDAETDLNLPLEAERQKTLASVENDAEDSKANRAMAMFEQVQARKRERMELKNEQEQKRLNSMQASQSTIDVLEKIAASSDDPTVQMEALKQLAELRKADVSGQRSIQQG